MIKLRSYQEECLNDCIEWIKKSIEPAVVDATVSFGKSITIVMLADIVSKMSGKKVLITCPDGNLVKQNAKEAKKLNIKTSIFSASLKSKSLRHPIVIGTPKTIANYLEKFGSEFAMMLIDEGDGLTKSIIAIYNQLKATNPNARCIGFTGTPYRTKTGYIYKIDLAGNPVPATKTIDPFYTKLIHRTTTQDLLGLGYLTPMLIGASEVEKYDTRHLDAKASESEIIQVFEGQNRKTANIVADIVQHSKYAEGVMIFGATRQHCEEILSSLPNSQARVIAHGMKSNEKNMEDFLKGKYKFLINRDMATVGANFPHVGVIAVLRKTSSARLLQQILGRGIRLHKDNWVEDPGTPELRKESIAKGPKPFCLYLDYTEDNIETHFPDGDLWNPNIEVPIASQSHGEINCKCPECGVTNTFSARKNKDGFDHDSEGYWVDLEGNRIETDHGPVPAHMGRRCLGMTLEKGGVYSQCSYRWSSKKCPDPMCNADNDIAARYCCACKGEIIDPNKFLKEEYARRKRDLSQVQRDVVMSWAVRKEVTTKGKSVYKIKWTTPNRSFETQTYETPMWPKALRERDIIMNATAGLKVKPRTISYVRDPKTKFFSYLAFNEPEDVEP